MAFTFRIEYWLVLSIFINVIVIIILTMVGLWTNAFRELRARSSKYIMATFYADNGRMLERVPTKLDTSNIIKHDHYGGFMVDKGSVYVDAHTKIPHAVFMTGTSKSINVEAAYAADQLYKVSGGDPSFLRKVREDLDAGLIKPNDPIIGIRENISLSPIRHMLDTFTPNMMRDGISKEVQVQVRQLGKMGNKDIMMILAIVGGIALIAVVLIIVLKNNGLDGGAAPAAIQYIVSNSSIIS